MKNEKELLNLFVDKTGKERLYCIASPFAQGGFVFATDSYICIRVKQELCEDEYEETRFPNALKVLPITENDQYSDVPLSVFEDALSEAPRSEGYPICDECDGSGEVDLWLNGLMFRPEHIENVIKTAKMLGNDTLHILKWPSKDNTLFIIDIGADADPSAVRIAILPISIETVSPNEYCHKINALPNEPQGNREEMKHNYYVSIRTGKLLKKAGFSKMEYCDYYEDDGGVTIAAPTLWQALCWLREKKKLSVRLNYITEQHKWFADILDMERGSYFDETLCAQTYEEACEDGIQAACKYIIEKGGKV